MEKILADWQHWLVRFGLLAVAIGILLLVLALLFRLALKVVSTRLETLLIQYSRQPARAIFSLLLILAALPFLQLPKELYGPLEHGVILALIASIGWLLAALTKLFEDLLSSKYRIDVKDNLLARQIQTRMHVLRRITGIIIVVVTASIMLMTFPSIQRLGTSMLASAGLAGLIVGMAARPTLSNLIAGIQIALTEPIRIEDVVIVENEWGWIEEIGATYVVVRIWDLRRLVLPLSYFIERPFQNWTRVTADLLKTVYVYTDYMVPVAEVRQELHRILQTTDKWDGKVWNLQVTNADEHAVEMRALMSAKDSGTGWDLTCYVREKLIDFLQKKYPECLPKTRAEIRPFQPGETKPDAP